MKHPKRPRDINQLAYQIVKEATEECSPGVVNDSAVSTAKTRNPAAVALGKLGAAKGGRARADKLSAEERRTIAKKAAASRWKKSRQPD